MRLLGITAGLLSTALLASACNGSEPPPNAAPPSSGTVGSGPLPPGSPDGPPTGQACNAEAAQFAVGRVATPALVENARQAAGARMVRVLRPGLAVTQEFSPDRLNLTVDEGGVVTDVSCW